MSGMIWAGTDADTRVQAVKGLIERGYSATLIARKFTDSPSRSAILGFCRRQGLRLASEVPKKTIRVPKKDPKPRPRVAKPPAPAFTPPDPMDFMGVTKLNRCRWPLFDQFEGPEASLFCGAERAPSVSYCRHHHERSRVKE